MALHVLSAVRRRMGNTARVPKGRDIETSGQESVIHYGRALVAADYF